MRVQGSHEAGHEESRGRLREGHAVVTRWSQRGHEKIKDGVRNLQEKVLLQVELFVRRPIQILSECAVHTHALTHTHTLTHSHCTVRVCRVRVSRPVQILQEFMASLDRDSDDPAGSHEGGHDEVTRWSR